MHRWWICIFLLVFLQANAQQNTLPMQSFYKDRMYHQTQNVAPFKGASFYPILESQYELHAKIKDSSKQYYTFSEILFKKHLLEFKGKNYYLTISPVLNFTYGKDVADTNNRELFQNTRGITVEGDLFQNFSFTTNFYENQSRNTLYQTQYYQSRGELYPKLSDSTYYSQNAIIPGAARTKKFKGDGFDYAFASGNIVYNAFRKFYLIAGNTSHFVGDGYRSILLSDNSTPAPFFQIKHTINNRWEWNYLRSKQLNLLRKPASSTPESYYEAKAYAVNYVNFKATENWNIALFEGAQFSRGDSVTSRSAHPMFYNPVPFLSSFVLPKNEVASVLGLNTSYALSPLLIYSQIAGNNSFSGYGVQVGTRILEPFEVEDLYVQLEANYVEKNLYLAENTRLNYAHYNLPIGHVKPGEFLELLVRANYEWKRMFISTKMHYYNLKSYSRRMLLPIYEELTEQKGSILFNETRIGYRFNRKVNLEIFGSILFREEILENTRQTTTLFSVGLKTGLRNNYIDF